MDDYDHRTPLPGTAPWKKIVGTVFAGDLFGEWVPQEWIDLVFEKVRRNSAWTFLFISKYPARMAEQRWPENAWASVTVDKQSVVEGTEEVVGSINARLRAVWVMPMLEPVQFRRPELFDWYIVGGCRDLGGGFTFPAPNAWVDPLVRQAKEVGAAVTEEYTERAQGWVQSLQKGIPMEDPRTREIPYFDSEEATARCAVVPAEDRSTQGE